jgi:hypothetical protein
VFSYIKEIQILEQQQDLETQTIQKMLFPTGFLGQKNK